MPNDEQSASPPSAPPLAWQPVTPRGVAAFAQATLSRLLLMELIVGFLAAASIVWFLAAAWFPTIRQAVRQLPEQGSIRSGRLDSPQRIAQTLGETNFLTIVLDLERQRNVTQSSDLLIEFHQSNFQVCSIFGCLLLNYPKGWDLEFNRLRLAPLWEAWEPILLGIGAVVVIVAL